MSERRKSIHGQWSSRWAFILAATGSAVGLGNIWKFPYMAGQNGGGAFVLIYLLCILLVGLPIMMAEVMLGRRGRQSPINTMDTLAEEVGASRRWTLLGWGGMLAGFIILSFYSVIAGWTLAYIPRAAAGVFDGVDAEGIGAIFGGLISDPERLLAWHTIFMAMTIAVTARGVQSGLEKAVRILMPALFILLLIMVGYAMSTDSFQRGLEFMFYPDFSKITGSGVLAAMGQAFFSLSLGMGAIMVYGSYLPSKASIAQTTFVIAMADTAVAILAGVAIFPIVFAYGLEPSAGPGLIFQALPLAFGHIPGGDLFATLFFVLLFFAAWTSAISLVEPAVAWLVENHGLSRVMAAAWVGIATWGLGMFTVFSFNILSEPVLFGKTFFDLLDYLTSNIMLPLGGLLISLFAGYFLPRAASEEELHLDPRLYAGWRFLVRFVAPLAVTLIFLNAIGVI